MLRDILNELGYLTILQGCSGTGIPYRYPVSQSSRRLRKKKMDASTTGPQTTELRILEHIVVYTDSVGNGLASGGTIKHQKLVK